MVSTSKVSRAAPPIALRSRALTNAGSSTIGPREMLTSMAVFFHQTDFMHAHESPSAVAQTNVHRNNVTFTEQSVLVDQRRAAFSSPFGGQVLAPRNHPHVERIPHARHQRTDVSPNPAAPRVLPCSPMPT